MNGVSLWCALAALGVSSQVETVGNVPTYVIRVEAPLLEELSQGREIVANVTPKDRGVRRFRILVTPEKAFQPRTANDVPGRADSLVEYEAVPLQNQEIELWVQIAPDRLVTLAAGKFIEGEVPQEASQVHRFRVFVGANELPRQQGTAPGQAPSFAAQLPGANYQLAPAAAETRTQLEPSGNRAAPSGVRAAQLPGAAAGLSNSAPLLNTSAPASPGFGSPNTTGSGGFSSRIGATLRNAPDQSTAPPLIDRGSYAPSPAFPGYGPESSYGQTASPPYNNSYSQPPPYAERPANPGSSVPTSNPYGWPPQYANQGNGPLAPQAPPPTQPVFMARPDSQAAPPQSAPMQVPSPAYGNPPLAVAQTAAPIAAAAAQTPTAAPPPTIVTKVEEQPKSSTPLILTTLALFTSLGVNAYLGWLAYSFFWRYRDAVHESVRARAFHSSARQAA